MSVPVLVRRVDVILFMVLAALFKFFPGIDITVSGQFFDAATGKFLYAKAPFVLLVDTIFDNSVYVYILALIALTIAAIRYSQRNLGPCRNRCLYLIAVVILGPGLLINGIIKEHSGRARPYQIAEFGGDRQFTPAFTLAQECEENCAFVSGHASAGFVLISLAWALRQRRWFIIGIVAGTIAGFGRIVQGKHYLSDIVFSFWAVYLCAALAAWFILGSVRISPLAGKELPPPVT